MLCKFDKQFPENVLFSCTQTIEEACIVLIGNLSKGREVAPPRPCEGKKPEPAIALFRTRLHPALCIEFVDDFGNRPSGKSQAVGQLTWRSLSLLMKFPEDHPFRNRSLLLVQRTRKTS